MKVLGIDPGLRITGYGVVELRKGSIEPTLIDGGYFKLSAKASLEDRLDQLHRELDALIQEVKPGRMAVEKLYSHYNHPRTAILMAHARGVILLCARQRDIAVDHLPSTAVKKAVTGHGHASKEQMQRAVQAQCRLKEPPSPPDVADAIAIALTCARRIAVDRL
ncbi:MAG: crossover junction endodeoxyribonuclease RuvC [Planctomycetes bacterium]|nr:crossover junction endodeoxyribonuclease RuvC [Planctomycetota bacterium]